MGVFTVLEAILCEVASDLIVRIRRAWQWGLVLVSDAESRESVPGTFDGAVVVGGSSFVVSRILHEVDGEPTAEIWLDRHPTDMTCVYDAPFLASSGRLRVSDAAQQDAVEAPVERETRQARVYVDDEEFPELVIVSLDRRTAELRAGMGPYDGAPGAAERGLRGGLRRPAGRLGLAASDSVRAQR